MSSIPGLFFYFPSELHLYCFSIWAKLRDCVVTNDSGRLRVIFWFCSEEEYVIRTLGGPCVHPCQLSVPRCPVLSLCWPPLELELLIPEIQTDLCLRYKHHDQRSGLQSWPEWCGNYNNLPPFSSGFKLCTFPTSGHPESIFSGELKGEMLVSLQACLTSSRTLQNPESKSHYSPSIQERIMWLL